MWRRLSSRSCRGLHEDDRQRAAGQMVVSSSLDLEEPSEETRVVEESIVSVVEAFPKSI